MKKFFKGFTLIEVLVVVSIISILAAVLYASFGEARTDARNKAVQAELKEVQLAIELYKAQEGRYPEAFDGGGCRTGNDTVGYISTYNTCYDNFPADGLITGDFLADSPDPDDSANDSCDYIYYVDGAGESYKLTAENCHGGASSQAEGIQPDNSEFSRCPDTCDLSSTTCDPAQPDFYTSYAIYSDGAQCR